MAEVRINGRRTPTLQAINNTSVLVNKLEALAQKENSVITELFLNGKKLDIDNPQLLRLKLEAEDAVEVKFESPERLSLESLRIAQDMAELLIFDIKVATLQLWDQTQHQEKTLQTLLTDCQMFLNLGMRPILLLGLDIYALPKDGENCMKHMDAIANALEDTTLLATHNKSKEACKMLVSVVLPCIERWLSYSTSFYNVLIENCTTTAHLRNSHTQETPLATTAH